jgi:hypothetical protein
MFLDLAEVGHGHAPVMVGGMVTAAERANAELVA